jgi:hypothetical protein
MSKVIVNNTLDTVNDVEAHRDGYYARRPDGRLLITQEALRAHAAAVAKLEKLHSFIKDALEKGGDVETGDFDAGIFNEPSKKPNWRGEFVKLGGDPKAVNDTTPKTDAHRLRIFVAGEKQKGERLAPSADGAPVAPVVKAEAAAE